MFKPSQIDWQGSVDSINAFHHGFKNHANDEATSVTAQRWINMFRFCKLWDNLAHLWVPRLEVLMRRTNHLQSRTTPHYISPSIDVIIAPRWAVEIRAKDETSNPWVCSKGRCSTWVQPYITVTSSEHRSSSWSSGGPNIMQMNNFHSENDYCWVPTIPNAENFFHLYWPRHLIWVSQASGTLDTPPGKFGPLDPARPQ